MQTYSFQFPCNKADYPSENIEDPSDKKTSRIICKRHMLLFDEKLYDRWKHSSLMIRFDSGKKLVVVPFTYKNFACMQNSYKFVGVQLVVHMRIFLIHKKCVRSPNM